MAGLDLNAEDAALMDRLFGPRLDGSGMEDAAEAAKSVSWAGGLGDYRPALSILLSGVIHGGIGGGTCFGWRLYALGDETCLEVCRVKADIAKAA